MAIHGQGGGGDWSLPGRWHRAGGGGFNGSPGGGLAAARWKHRVWSWGFWKGKPPKMQFFWKEKPWGDSKNSSFFWVQNVGEDWRSIWDFPFPYAPKPWKKTPVMVNAWKGSLNAMFSSHTWIYWILLQDFDDLDVSFWNNRAGWWPSHRPAASGNWSDSSVFNSFRLVTWLNYVKYVKSSSSNFSLVSKPIYIHYLHPFTSVYTTGRANHFLVETDARRVLLLGQARGSAAE